MTAIVSQNLIQLMTGWLGPPWVDLSGPDERRVTGGSWVGKEGAVSGAVDGGWIGSVGCAGISCAGAPSVTGAG